jgi:hypothetical protein
MHSKPEILAFDFPEDPQVIPVLSAKIYPANSKELIITWNKKTRIELLEDMSRYATNKEFDRFKMMDEQWFRMEISLQWHQITFSNKSSGNTTKNSSSTFSFL